MRKNNIADLPPLDVVNGKTQTPRIDSHPIVDNERGKMLPRRRAAVIIKCAGK